MVAPILNDVRERGDEALLEYASKFDKFDRKSVRLNVEGTLTPEFAGRRSNCRRQHSRVRRAATSARDLQGISRRSPAGSDRASAGFNGRVHSRGPLSPALHRSDERDSSAGGGRENDLRRMPSSQRRKFWGSRNGWASRICSRWAERTQSPLWPMAPKPFLVSSVSSDPEISTSRRQRN